MLPTNNWSLHAIPGAFILAFAPHAYYNFKLFSATKRKATNITPRQNLELFKSTLSPEILDQLHRARAAHFNGLEGFPLFAAAIIAGNMANLPVNTLNLIAIQYLGVRVIYDLLYLTARSEFMGFMRSATWTYGVGLTFYTLIKAGNALAEAKSSV